MMITRSGETPWLAIARRRSAAFCAGSSVGWDAAELAGLNASTDPMRAKIATSAIRISAISRELFGRAICLFVSVPASVQW